MPRTATKLTNFSAHPLLPRARSRKASTCKGGVSLPQRSEDRRRGGLTPGLQYFGKRFLNPLLGRWVSADPLAVHVPGEADLNVYAYVSGAVLKSVDPLGLQAEQEGNYFNDQWRQSQGPNASSGSSAEPAPSGDGNSNSGDKEFNNGIGTDNGESFAAGDPLDGSLDGNSTGGFADAGDSTPNQELGALGHASAAAAIISGQDPLSNDASATPLGIPGGFGPKANGSRAAQAAFVAGTAASEGWAGRLLGGIKKLWSKLGKIGDLFKRKPSKTIVIGEDMQRVEKYAAENPGVETYPGPPEGVDGMEHNRQWLRDQIEQGAVVDDIGPAFSRRRDRAAKGKRGDSPFYGMERTETKNYPKRRKRFERRGRTEGGLPGE